MADQNELQVVLGLESSDFNKDLKKSEQSVKTFATNVNKTFAGASTGLQTMVPASQRAGAALTNLSRVVSDAPFGFIAIQNNIEPLLSSFAQLQKQSGGTAGALRAIGASLIGPAGLAVGLSVVTSLVTTAIQKYGSLGNAIDQLFISTSAAAQAQSKLNTALSESGNSVAGEVSKLNALLSIARDINRSAGERQQALDVINKQYDEYLPKLTLETINSDKAKDATDRLTASLKRQAQVRGLQELITKETQAQAELLTKPLQSNLSLLDQLKIGFLNMGNASQIGTQLVVEGAKETTKQLQKAEDQIAVYQSALKKLLGEEAGAGTLSPGLKESKPAKVEVPAEITIKPVKVMSFQEAQFQSALDRLLDKQPIILPALQTNIIPQIDPNYADNVVAQLSAGGQRAGDQSRTEQERERVEKLANAVTGLLTPAFSDFFDTLLEGSESPFTALTKAFGRLLKQILATLASAAALAAILSLIPGAGGFIGNFTKLLGGGGLGQLAGLLGGGSRPLQAKVGGGTLRPMQVYVTGQLRGNDIYLQNQRQGAYNRMIF